jgi:predicted small lipoprotein YifL
LKKKFVLTISTSIATLLLVSACGQKGPLYLPEKKVPATSSHDTVKSQAASAASSNK